MRDTETRCRVRVVRREVLRDDAEAVQRREANEQLLRDAAEKGIGGGVGGRYLLQRETRNGATRPHWLWREAVVNHLWVYLLEFQLGRDEGDPTGGVCCPPTNVLNAEGTCHAEPWSYKYAAQSGERRESLSLGA